MEDWVTIKNLKARNPDMGTRKIAHLLGISRNTVRKALESKKVPKYQRKEIINPAIVPYVDIINTMYWQKHFKGSRILNEITSKGFKGSKNAFYRYFKKIRSEEPRNYTPYETAPREQAQFDWSFYTVQIDNVLTRVVIFSYILGFCRYVIFDISLSDNQGSVFEAMENALRETGGVPERIQTDNAKSFVVNASKDHFKWNSRYLQFCGHYGIRCRQSKKYN